jgi:hypothetical protein
MSKATEGVGFIRLGKVSSHGKWEISDGQLLISFDPALLSQENRNELERYRRTSKPLAIHLWGVQKPKRGVVIGFDRSGQSAIFYVSHLDED